MIANKCPQYACSGVFYAFCRTSELHRQPANQEFYAVFSISFAFFNFYISSWLLQNQQFVMHLTLQTVDFAVTTSICTVTSTEIRANFK